MPTIVALPNLPQTVELKIDQDGILKLKKNNDISISENNITISDKNVEALKTITNDQ